MTLPFRPLLLSLALCLSLSACDTSKQSDASKQSDHRAPAATTTSTENTFMVAAAHPLAVEAGLKMLRAGGSAVDAAIAVQLMLTLVEPESSGIGGGAFMLLHDPQKNITTSFDGRETAPASARPDMFLKADGTARNIFDAIPGGLSVGVPGTLHMLDKAHKSYGRLPWADLFTPAIQTAEQGFPVGRKLAAALKAHPEMKTMPDMRAYFYHADGTAYAQGEMLRNPAYAQTLRLIARDGIKAFYEGPVAQAMIDKIAKAPKNPARMTLADLTAYRAIERAPVCGVYRSHKICSMGPPSSGGVAVLQILGMLEKFDPKTLQPNQLSTVHLFTQASRLAFADRATYLGDPASISIPLSGLLDPAYLRQRARLIDPARDMGKAQPGTPPRQPGEQRADYAPQSSPQLPGTSHLSIIDAQGQAVSMTTTIEYAFGARLITGGFLLNNELTDFSFEPVKDGKPVANAPAPGKRPMSAMSPSLVFKPDGTVWIATGSPGGPRIIAYTAQSLISLIDGGQTPQQAAALPHYANLNGPTLLEEGTPITALQAPLEAMGHEVRQTKLESGLHIIRRDIHSGGLEGGADPRRDGTAQGNHAAISP